MRRALLAVAVLLLAAAAVVAALPWLARPLLMGALSAALGTPVSIAALRWDPGAGGVVADDVRIGTGADAANVRRLTLTVDPRALDLRQLAVERITVEAPVARLTLDEELRPLRGAGGGGGLPALPLPVMVREVVVTDATIAVRPPGADADLAVAVRRAVASDVALDAGGGLRFDGELTGSVDRAPLTASGTVALTADGPRLRAELSLSQLPVRDGLLRWPAPVTSVAGTLDATARVDVGDPPTRAAIALDLRLDRARLAGPAGVDVRAARLELPAVRVDLAERHLDLGAVAVREPVLSLDLAAAAAAPASAGAGGGGWAVRSGPLTVRGGELRLRRGDAGARVQLERVRWDGLRDAAAPLAVTARAADGGTFAVDGSVRASPLAAELDVRVADLTLAPWARLLDLPVRLARGSAGGTAHLVYRGGLQRVAGDVRVRDVHTLPPDPTRPIEVLAVASAAAAFAWIPGEPATIELPSLSLDYPYAMVVRGAAGTFPYSLLAGGADGGGAPAALRVGRLDVIGGKIELVDETFEPSFWTSLTGLSGSVEAIAWPERSIGRFALAGKRDELSPVALSGTLSDAGLGGRLELRDVLLDSLTPYVAPRLGYRFTAGRLSTVATADPEPPLLVSSADVVLQGAEVLQTGTDVILEQSGVPLPIALGLISGPGGRIDLTLPFSIDTRSGDVAVGSVVWQAVRKAVVAALTSPLRALGSLFGLGGAPHAFAVDPIPFPPGSAALDAAGRARVGEIARIVHAHAGLLLVLLPQITDADRQAVGAAGVAALARARNAAARAAFVDGTPGPALPAARLLLAPWEPSTGATATNQSGVYVELQDAG